MNRANSSLGDWIWERPHLIIEDLWSVAPGPWVSVMSNLHSPRWAQPSRTMAGVMGIFQFCEQVLIWMKGNCLYTLELMGPLKNPHVLLLCNINQLGCMTKWKEVMRSHEVSSLKLLHIDQMAYNVPKQDTTKESGELFWNLKMIERKSLISTGSEWKDLTLHWHHCIL